MGSKKSLARKTKMGVMIKKNRPIPNWIRQRTDNKITYNFKRRNWRRTKIGF
jgi:large subunit ribosomal protein L39e